MSLSTRLISTAASAALLVTGIVGGYAGNLLAEENAAALTAQENVATMIAQNLSAVDYLAGTQARATLAEFASVTDAASALVASSDTKASQDSRNALQAILDEIKVKVAAHVETGAEARDAAEQIVATGSRAIAAASKVVSDEIAAWEAEQARIAAEKAAAEAAAQAEREAAQRPSGYSNSNSNNGGGSNSGSSGGSSNGGGGDNSSSGRAWAEGIVYSIAPNVSQIVWDYTPLGGSYGGMHKSGAIYLSNSVADGSGYAYSILVHEATHAGPQRGSCNATWQGHFGGDAERFAQAYTVAHFGTSVAAYAYPTQADLNAAGAC